VKRPVTHTTQAVISAIKKPSAPTKPDVEISSAPFVLVEELEQDTLDGIVKFCDSVRSAHWIENNKFSGTKLGNDSSKTNLVKEAITSIENPLECHVSTVGNAADSSLGQVKWNAKAAGSSATGIVSGELLLSG
jgi:hypothetical protein